MIINNKFKSLSSKISLTFVILGVFLVTILFLQIIPNMQKEQEDNLYKDIENYTYLTNQQIQLAEKSIKNYGRTRLDQIKGLLALESQRIVDNINKSKKIDLNDVFYKVQSKKITCNTTILNQNDEILYQNNKESFGEFISQLQNKSFLKKDFDRDYICPIYTSKIFYKQDIKSLNQKLLLSCSINSFKTYGKTLEHSLKGSIQKSFSLREDLHKGKIYLIWINNEQTKNANEPLLNKNDDPRYNKKYCVSKISKFKSPKTGNLSGKEIFDAIGKEPISHMLNGKKTLTWVKEISLTKKRAFLYITSIYEEDLSKKLNSSLNNVLPAAIISLLFAILLGYLIFKRLFKSINILTNTSKMVDEGDLSKRNNIKGDDDIAVLAHSFDLMLDSIQRNIKELDNKVDEKTKQLTSSLNEKETLLSEKETLLKEIHHRVKNNLAITINLIKLEKSKIKNQDTKNSLSNIEDRIFVMELLHRKLYESKDLNSISFKKYIEELSEDLHKTYSYVKKIQIKTFIEDIKINIDYALPLGLIITELITNSFKYAFKEDHGLIEIFFNQKDNNCELVFKDNGIGLSKDIDINNCKSLGLQIISNLSQGQLFGSFDYIYEEGSKFIIKFEIKEDKDLNED